MADAESRLMGEARGTRPVVRVDVDAAAYVITSVTDVSRVSPFRVPLMVKG